MGEYSAEITVDASVERAFEVFVDASRYPQWQAAAGIGHLSLVMLGPGELDGYRTWLGSGGGVFD